MDLLTRRKNESKSYLHQKMCTTPSSPSSCYPNNTCQNQQSWHLHRTVKVESYDEQSTSDLMDYQEQTGWLSYQQTTSCTQFETGNASLFSRYFGTKDSGLLCCAASVVSNPPCSQKTEDLVIPLQQNMQQQHEGLVRQDFSTCAPSFTHLLPTQENGYSYTNQQINAVNETSNYLVASHTDASNQSQNTLAQVLYMKSQRLRVQPHIRPKPSDVAFNMKDCPPPAPLPEAWCHAYYYELNQRIGEPFKGGTSHVIVDGFCAPSEAERFCLGALANVNRNPGVVNARRQIGRGVRIFRQNEDVYAECLSEAPVFIQSPIHAIKSHDHPATVYRLPSGHVMQIFDNESFERLLTQSTSQGFHAVYSLQRMCHMRISFVKGWGEQYKRQTITSTPCWVEIHLAIPLQKLDRVLSQIPGPNDPIHSFT
ncbi:unnamed protein product [Thelazia callipaeda]|uniref:MH2 domain-containing protein n=1 Tax=Thelazia callipaeda TaxID=103827 RepID=A0A0N5D3L6_THECL|nr:unnamed protein product [Thelazia callipaeda]